MNASSAAKRKPEYLKLYEKLRHDIVSGAYAQGVRLPSKRALSENFAVSVVTAEHALALLSEEGYIEPRQRSGYFVIYREEDGFSVNESSPPTFSPDPTVRHDDGVPFSLYAKAVRRVMSQYESELMTKPPNSGCDVLRRALSLYLIRSRGMDVSPDQVIIGSGSEYLYGQIVQLLGRERIYAAEDPSYEKILRVYEASGARCRLLPLGRDGIKSGALIKSDASVLHITPYRSFPSGVTASAAKKREYIRWASSRDGFIIEDDVESEFTLSSKPEETVFSLDKEGRVIFLNTFSRTVAPSIRTGYMVLPPDLLDSFWKSAGFYSCTVPALEQYVLAELIDSGVFERHINRIRREKRRLFSQKQK